MHRRISVCSQATSLIAGLSDVCVILSVSSTPVCVCLSPSHVHYAVHGSALVAKDRLCPDVDEVLFDRAITNHAWKLLLCSAIHLNAKEYSVCYHRPKFFMHKHKRLDEINHRLIVIDHIPFIVFTSQKNTETSWNNLIFVLETIPCYGHQSSRYSR